MRILAKAMKSEGVESMTRKVIVWLIVSSFALILVACGSTPKSHRDLVEEAISEGNWNAAYGWLYMDIVDSNPDVSGRAKKLAQQYPKIVQAAKTRLSDEGVRKRIESGGDGAIDYLKTELDAYKLVASPAEFQLADAVVTPVVTQLTQRRKEETIIGLVMDVQVTDESHVNPGVGAQLGAAVAQSRYLDTTTINNYKATGQLKSGVAGAVVGSLLDKPTEILFRHTYFIRKLDGDIYRAEYLTSDQTHQPIGACVEARSQKYIVLITQSTCK